MRVSKRKWPLLVTIVFCVFSLVWINNLHSETDPPNSFNHSFYFDFSKLVPNLLSSEDLLLLSRSRNSAAATLSHYPVNNYPFEYLPRPDDRKCLSHSFVLLIKSAIFNFHNRNILRKYLCGNRPHLNYTLTWFFFVGMTSPDQERWNKSLHHEAAHYSDLIQVNFVDDYMNNTLKLISEIFWIRDRICKTPTAGQRFIFMDDDVFLNLRRIPLLQSSAFERPALYGHKNVNASPFRWRWSKWYISRQEYSSDTFPPYVSGSTIITNRDAIFKVSSIIPYVKYFPFDDVFLGIIAELAGLRVVDEKRILVHYKCGLFCHEDPASSIAIHVPNHLTKLERFYFENSISSF